MSLPLLCITMISVKTGFMSIDAGVVSRERTHHAIIQNLSLSLNDLGLQFCSLKLFSSQYLTNDTNFVKFTRLLNFKRRWPLRNFFFLDQCINERKCQLCLGLYDMMLISFLIAFRIKPNTIPLAGCHLKRLCCFIMLATSPSCR